MRCALAVGWLSLGALPPGVWAVVCVVWVDDDWKWNWLAVLSVLCVVLCLAVPIIAC